MTLGQSPATLACSISRVPREIAARKKSASNGTPSLTIASRCSHFAQVSPKCVVKHRRALQKDRLKRLEAHLLTDVIDIIGLLFALQMKHLLADYCLQTKGMIQNRRRYGHRDGIAHVFVHGAGSLLVFALFGAISGLVFAIIFGEMLIHYHIDWAKDNLVQRMGVTTEDRSYWIAAGTDQALHHATYLVMVLIWVGLG